MRAGKSVGGGPWPGRRPGGVSVALGLPDRQMTTCTRGPAMMRMVRFAGVFLLVYALAVPAVLADWVKLKDGTVLEGTVISRGDGSFWVKSADGTTRTIAGADVLSNGKGAPPKPAGAAPA